MLTPGARLVAGQVTAPTIRSSTPTVCSVTLPVLVTTNVYAMVAPAAWVVGVPAVFDSAIDGVAATVVSVLSCAVTTAVVGAVPLTVAVLATWPASTSICVR